MPPSGHQRNKDVVPFQREIEQVVQEVLDKPKGLGEEFWVYTSNEVVDVEDGIDTSLAPALEYVDGETPDWIEFDDQTGAVSVVEDVVCVIEAYVTLAVVTITAESLYFIKGQDNEVFRRMNSYFKNLDQSTIYISGTRFIRAGVILEPFVYINGGPTTCADTGLYLQRIG